MSDAKLVMLNGRPHVQITMPYLEGAVSGTGKTRRVSGTHMGKGGTERVTVADPSVNNGNPVLLMFSAWVNRPLTDDEMSATGTRGD